MQVRISSCLFVLLEFLTTQSLAGLASWDQFIQKYETTHINLNHIRERRALSPDQFRVKFELEAFGSTLKVSLDSNTELFPHSPQLTVVDRWSSTTEPLDISQFYQGHVMGEDNSRVHGYIIDGVFDGMINTENESYYVEPASRYLDMTEGDNTTIVYRLSDLNVELLPDLNRRVKGAKTKDQSTTNESNLERRTRAVVEDRLASKHCPVHVYVDHRFFSLIGKSNMAQTVKEVIHHMAQADTIFRTTSFDGSGKGNNIGLLTSKITVFKDADSDPTSDLKDGVEAQTFLDRFTEIDHSHFCLAVLLTTVDFAHGVLGLAWIADFKSDTGICARPRTLPHSSKPGYYNSGVVSFVNFGEVVSRTSFSLTLVHEIGHSFGAEHDDVTTRICSPGGSDGNFVMFHISGDGLKPNHFLFSSCSINSMHKIIKDQINVCFMNTYQGFCSNAILDENEQCDCGSESTCAEVDQCCNAFVYNSSDNCQLKLTSRCSPSASVCCDPQTCDVVAAEAQLLCSPQSECAELITCNGKSAECPKAANLPDGTLCNNNLQVCESGKCSRSVCQFHGHRDCYCSGTERDCMVCCLDSSTGECKPATQLGITAGLGGMIPSNGLCANGSGVCSKKGICIFKNGTYSTADLGALFQQTASLAINTLASYWYYTLVAMGTSAGLVGLFIVIHRNTQHTHSMAYKDGRMAKVWFEVRYRLAKLEAELNALDTYNPYKSMPFPVASKRIAYQFPTAPQSVCTRFILSSNSELEAVRLLTVAGYPMRRLLEDKVQPVPEKVIKVTTLSS